VDISKKSMIVLIFDPNFKSYCDWTTGLLRCAEKGKGLVKVLIQCQGAVRRREIVPKRCAQTTHITPYVPFTVPLSRKCIVAGNCRTARNSTSQCFFLIVQYNCMRRENVLEVSHERKWLLVLHVTAILRLGYLYARDVIIRNTSYVW
jgi:hypothetical protein